jgi:hypothetical protein
MGQFVVKRATLKKKKKLALFLATKRAMFSDRKSALNLTNYHKMPLNRAKHEE